MNVISTVIMLTAATVVACALPSSSPEERVGDAPDLEATVEVLVEEKLKEIQKGIPSPISASPTPTLLPPTATPTPMPLYFPTYFDYESAMLARFSVDTPQLLRDALLKDVEYEKAAAAYVLGACLDKHVLTREGFRSYMMGRSQNTPGKEAVAKLANIDGLSNLIELASMEDECMRPFTFPITENDWALAFGLMEYIGGSPLFSPYQGAALRERRRQARSWEYGESRDRPFIFWLCEVMY